MELQKAMEEEKMFIQDLFAITQSQTPGAIAVCFEGNEMSYGELNRKAAALANQIILQNSESLFVGISSTRNMEMIVGLIAILKAGKAYLPLDPVYPANRLREMMTDSGIQICLSQRSESYLFGSLKADLSLLMTDESYDPAEIAQSIPSSNLAYLLYTSGSSGKPKGVSMGQQAMVNLLRWQKKNSDAGPQSKTLQFAPLSFDVSFQEIFSTLTSGGTLVLVTDDLRLDPVRLLQLIDSRSIQRIFLPFVALQFLSDTANANRIFPSSLKEIITAGEQLQITPSLRQFFSSLDNCVLYNQYGPTETHVVTALKLDGNPNDWPALPGIGKPIDQIHIYILDENGILLPDGATGEITVSGSCLAEGYLNQQELTSEKFIQWSHPTDGDIRIYKTGDLGRWLPDGTIEFQGRRDDQVKIRGYRVEPGEIELLINHQSGINQAVVVTREDQAGEKKLVAYVISSNGTTDTAALRSVIGKQLPDYMMPSAFVWLKRWPKTSSGKIDRKSLPKPETSRPELSVLYKTPLSEMEKNISACWAQLLDLDRVGVNDNFFELGGNSLLALKSVSQLNLTHRYELPITKLYQNPTISAISAFLNGSEKLSLPDVDPKGAKRANTNDIAVIAMSGRFPGANTIDELWQMLKDGRETISFFTIEELDEHIPAALKKNPDYIRARGIIDKTDEFDAAFFGINPRLASLMDPQQRIFLEIAWEALESSGYFPSKYKGTIGIFAGTGNNSYFLNNVQGHAELIEQTGSFQVMTANEKDYIASRTAYALDLKGPAVSVLSACSTSLLAIAEAVESIRNGQCEIALAGGVSITVPVKSGHVYQEGGMYSRDGHNRTFDADAAGTVFSDGAGVVLLKQLDQAVRDGDKIFSVIKGIGLNNDGAGKGSFTAPSAEGQAGAIRMAIQDAGVDPACISYVEAHGTATPLGDPIEIEGLNMAFGHTSAKQYCALGSIKSNIGHCTAAAGVAGLIKTSLALYHRKIPASINYLKPNPHIDFTQTAFYVNTELKNWSSQGKRVAGVSSFGVGGTNVHVVLEEYESLVSGIPLENNPNLSLQIFPLSAKTEKSLSDFSMKLSDLREENFNPADLAFTLQTSRESFKSRRFLIAGDKAELVRKLTSSIPSVEYHHLKESPEGVVFVFPGQGSQFLNMGKELYSSEPVFRQAFDECADLLMQIMNEDIRQIIFPAATTSVAEEKIQNTYYTQPVLFTIEYALARLWMSWGILPVAFIGHSIGEFVAAHLAGIFSLHDGLNLIFTRGRLMSSLPTGSMLSIRMEEDKIKGLLPAGLSIAAVNGPGITVVSGREREIEEFSQSLTASGIANKLLKTSHAFHSVMMDPILSSFEKLAKSIKMESPKIPIVSTLTGKWVRGTEMSSAGYWVRQLRNPVRFSEALKAISDQGNLVLLESGPGHILTNLVRHQGIKKIVPAIASMHGENGKSEHYSILHALGQLWLLGIEPDWMALQQGRKRQRMNLPSYAFDRIRCWVNPVRLTEQKLIVPDQTEIVTPSDSLLKEENILPGEKKDRKTVLTERLRNIFENASGIEMEMVSPDSNFIAAGFDSLLLTQVALNLKKEFGLPISFRQLNESLGSLDLLSGYLDDHLPLEVFPTEQKRDQVSDPSIQNLSRQIELLAEQVSLLQGKPLHGIRQLPSTIDHQLTEAEKAELVKPFGATARIEKQSSALNKKQLAFLEDLTRRYNKKTKRSKASAQESRSYMADPRVVSGFKPLTKEMIYSIVVNKSKGSRLWDIDGNEYIDALNGFGSNLLGYQPESVTKALHKQIDEGYELGPQHELASRVCKLICEFTEFDRAALCNTGSEAVLGAMRIARTVTGRSTIVAFSGSYHGIVDEVIVRGTKNGKSFPAAPGIMPEAVQNMLILDYGTDQSLQIIKERANEIAAVLVEPVQSRRPEFQPIEFLKALREITSASGTTLIFDEVITGFRMHPGGTQAMFGIKADLGTYGKVVAGGLPIGVIAGKKLFMDALDGGYWEYGNGSVPESGVTYFAGTFVRHPLALAASIASLEYMKTMGPSLQASLNEKTRGLTDALNNISNEKGLSLYIAQFGSLWKIKFREEIPYSELLFTLMREKGIHIWDGFPCFLTEAHTEADVKTIITKFEESVNEMLDAGFFVSSKADILLPATEPQIEIWLSCILGGDDANRSYNESVSLRLNGKLNVSVLERSLKEVLHRHEALRSTFSGDGKQILIHPEVPLLLQIEDLSGRSRKEQLAFIEDFKRQNALGIFNLLKGPLFKTALFALNDEEHFLTITAHHIICDGWSLGIILQDLGKYYGAFSKNLTPDLKPAPSFSEYAHAQVFLNESREYKKTEQYWVRQFQASVPVLDIPTDFPRPQERSYKSHRLDFPLDASLLADIKKIGATNGCTLASTLMGAFEVYLHRLTGQSDIILGMPAAGQSISGLYGLVGHCVNLLPMRSRPEGKMAFSSYLRSRRPQVLEDYEHQQITFGSLLKKLNIARDRSRVPLLPITFNVELDLDAGVDFPGLQYEMIYNPREYENFEISLNIGGSYTKPDIQWSYNTQLFKSSTIQRMMESFENLLRRVVADQDTLIMNIPVAISQQRVIEVKTSLYPKDKTIAALFSDQVMVTPNRRAVTFEKETITYRQLEERSNQLAHYLKSKGVKKEMPVPVCMERSIELITAILAILKAGAAYVPIDPAYPADRIRFMMQDTNAKILLTNRNSLNSISGLENKLIILPDEEWKYISQEPVVAPSVSGEGNDLAYIMYTSGSTGRPKGVMIENRNVISLVRGVSFVNFADKNVLLSTGSPAFDASSFEYWGMLLNGGELVLCNEEVLLNGELLKKEIKQRKINMMWFTSSLLNQWVDLDITVFDGLRTVIAGGEKLSEKHIEKLRNRYPSLDIINGYGPTENTTFSLTYPIREKQITQPVPIGMPLSNRTAYVLNNQLQLCGVGVFGELYVGGAGVGRGYLNRPDLTQEKFLADPFSGVQGAIMYRTGDLCRTMPDGNFEFLGRLDEQVKIRGFRIEPAEIESVIQQYAGIQHAVVVARGDSLSEKRLIAYVVPKGEFNKDEITLFLQSKLPAYMIPRVFIQLNRIPLTSNGKLDKKALPDPDLLPEFGNRKIKLAETEAQKMLATIWMEALHVQQISIDDNFFELGGHSLIAVRVMRTIEEMTHHRLPITALFEAPTIEKLSVLIEHEVKAESWKSLVAIKPEGKNPPLYIVHGSGLTVLIFHALAYGLDPEQPVFGLQARGLNGIDEPFDNMEEIAAYYVAEILEQNPQGPYNLAGYSFGGIVAFEMAKQLKSMGREVNMLAIFDTNADHSSHFDDWALKMSKKFKRQFPKFKFILSSLKKHPAETVAYQFNFLKNKFFRLLGNTGMVKTAAVEEEHLDFADKINYKHDIAFEKYKLTPYNGTIDLFRVKSRMYFLDDPIYLGWKPYALQGINIHEISGDHKTFLLSPNVQELTRILNEVINERNSGREIRKQFADPSSVMKAI